MVARLGHINRLPYREEFKSNAVKTYPLVNIFGITFNLEGNKLKKGEKTKKHWIQTHKGREARGLDTRLPERRIECLKSMRIRVCVMCSHESTRHCTCWVVIGGLPGKGGHSSVLPLGHPQRSQPALIGTADNTAHSMHLHNRRAIND